MLGLILVFLSTLAFALATDVWTLLAARLLEGLSTAIVGTVGYAMLTEVAGRENLGKVMGYTSMALSFGLLIGPVVGGVLYEYCGYYQVYFPAFGLIAMEVVLRLLVIEKGKKSSLAKVTSETSTCIAVDHAPPRDTLTEVDPLLVAMVQPINAYKAFLTSPRFIGVLISLFLLNSIACGFDSSLTPFIRDNFNMRATHAAALFLALAVPMLLAPLSGWATDRYGPKLPIMIGLALGAPSLAMLASVSKGTSSPFLKLLVLLAIVGLALALTLTPLRVEASLVIDCMEREVPGCFGVNGANGRAFGLMNMMSAAGVLVGPLYAGFVRVVAGWEVLSRINGALCVGMLVLVVLITSGKRKEKFQDMEAEV